MRNLDSSMLAKSLGPSPIMSGIAGFQTGWGIGEKFQKQQQQRKKREQEEAQQDAISNAISGMEGITPQMKQLMINDPDIRKMIFTQQVKSQLGGGRQQFAPQAVVIKDKDGKPIHGHLKQDQQGSAIFEPATMDGKPVEKWVRPISGKIEEDDKGNKLLVDVITGSAIPIKTVTGDPVVDPAVIAKKDEIEIRKTEAKRKGEELTLEKDKFKEAVRKTAVSEEIARLPRAIKNKVDGKLVTVRLAKKQLENLQGAWKDIKGGITAGAFLQGRIPSKLGKLFDKRAATLRQTIRQLSRTPGEGSMSDWEGRLAMEQIPDRINWELVTEDQIKNMFDLVELIENGYTAMLNTGQTIDVNPQSTLR